ncbi:lipoprotein [Spiroplasma eriocheiris]|uniref:Lipoprotein n=1 Tax=Spiroplasma eriocheiris TaxID=315358 RepID=A0A0H3XMS4_9MOLU|nr:lipoprotein [Spiroplasma eriocheiris]AHF57893.1 hypothetical protein SPE_0771 [Spiroplasma eriocheiris CCTCC M 207170]AKM54337.1 hypothetical protein SERIO_v1c07750 [Spiroplasma eriocheiris]
MKKLLTILSALTLISGTTTSIISCGGNHESSDIPSDSTAQDAKVLNDIANELNTKFLDFLNSNQVINSTDYGTIFDNFFGKVNESNQNVTLNPNDSDVKEEIKDITTLFQNYLNQVNIQIAQDYSNVYVSSYPVNWNHDQDSSSLGYIDLSQLSSLNPSVDITGLKAVSYQFNIHYNIEYKKISSSNNFTFNFIISNDPQKINQFQTESMAKLSGDIINYFSDEDIIIDKKLAYQKLYDNFDINYTTSHINLDNIVQSELISFLNSDPELTDIMQQVTWNDDKSILTLLSSAIDQTTNGIGVADSKYSSDHWAGKGFQPDQITPENFLPFYKQILKVFEIISDELQLASFNVNLAKISIAGLPLSGIVSNEGKPLTVTVGISKDGLDKKLFNFAKIVTSFMKNYHIESESDHWVLHVPKNLFDQIRNKKYDDALIDLTNDFINQEDIAKLEDIDMFTLGDETKQNHTWTIVDEHTIKLPKRITWNFDLMYGGKSINNSICYTPVTSWYFYLLIKDDLV